MVVVIRCGHGSGSQQKKLPLRAYGSMHRIYNTFSFCINHRFVTLQASYLTFVAYINY